MDLVLNKKESDKPKGTKVKPFTSKEGKKGGSYWDKWIRYFNKKIFDEPLFQKITKEK